jgi:hypothetical protein
MILTKTFSHDQFAEAVESWAWVGLEGKSPILATLFGDIILQSSEGYWFLDTLEGSLTLVWPDADSLESALASAEGQDQYLMGGLAYAAEQLGLSLGPTEVYDFDIPPVLGGPIDVDHLSTIDFVVSARIAAQIHQQVRNVAPGTKITGVTVDTGRPSKKSKFWKRLR